MTVPTTCATGGISESNSHRLCTVKAPLRYLVDAVSASSETISLLSAISISPSTPTPQDKGFVQRQDCASAKYHTGNLRRLSCFELISFTLFFKHSPVPQQGKNAIPELKVARERWAGVRGERQMETTGAFTAAPRQWLRAATAAPACSVGSCQVPGAFSVGDTDAGPSVLPISRHEWACRIE